MPELVLSGISKRFGAFQAVADLDLTVGNGEFVCLLGPSGCGKTTTLRMIAGFETADRGSLLLDGVDISNRPPNKRDIGMVFQHYALFPHKTVAQNVAFGLLMRGKSRAEQDEAVARTLQLVKLAHLADRFPRQLSGGQQQRVALARALAFQPSLLLMDEPLSNLDAQLRDEMRDEIKRVQQEVGTTTIFVTHDQSEALALADRVAVFSEGRLLQYSDPAHLYEQPSDRVVGRFIGKMNELEGRVVNTSPDGTLVALAGGGTVLCGPSELPAGTSVSVMIRYEALSVAPLSDGHRDAGLECRVSRRTYLGSVIEYELILAGKPLRVWMPNNSTASRLSIGDSATIFFNPSDALLFAV
ncbi:ABC transporter ATP-binding protein [Neorhizobium sp. P12A]|uniref:ABC transporter ATP-binding protein n=1 Tax=Neorhizobium sp. P12A TaxID=2268027 RepID=UPI0011EC3DB6|nr:ABC transporter ATP-binding protein [Neorhizobium sp. P12A]KAA0693678.1 ABC transporter ATP-binding protein [Neorhizobium sp. P12A]